MTNPADIALRPIDLNVLLDGIADGTVVLPDFQRDFVWSEGDVVALIATVMVGWPAGSLLLMKGAPTFFKTKEFQGAPPQKASVLYVVLDGQQRLTALFRALHRAGGVVYVVDLKALAAGRPSAETLEEALKPYPVAEWDAKMPIEAQARDRLVPLYVLRSASDYFQWRDRAVEAAPSEHRRALSDDLARAYKDFLGTVNHYDFPSVILDNELPTEAVARIFERVNRGGQELSTFDLLVARSYTRDWNLREEWTRARAESPLIDAYLGDDGLPAAQVLALKEIQDIRRPALLDMPRDVIQNGWGRAVTAMESALEFLSEAGMRHPAWLPYPTLSIPLAALALDHDLRSSRDVLEAWLWGRSFAGDYDVASSTKIASDYATLRRALADVERPHVEIPISRAHSATRRQGGSLWRAFLSLMLRKGARDLLTGEPLCQTPFVASEVVALPILPRSAGTDDAPHLRLLAQILMRRGRRGISQGGTLRLLIDSPDRPAGTDEWLQSQFLPPHRELAALALTPDRLFDYRSEAAMTYLLSDVPLLVELQEPTDG